MIAKYEQVQINQDDRTILSDLNLEINEGQFIYILGEVGCGKTSLIKTIYGELPIAQGEATVLDNDMTNMRPRKLPKLRRQLGIVFNENVIHHPRLLSVNVLKRIFRLIPWHVFWNLSNTHRFCNWQTCLKLIMQLLMRTER